MVWDHDTMDLEARLALQPRKVDLRDPDTLETLLTVAVLEAMDAAPDGTTHEAVIARLRDIEPALPQSDEELRGAIDAARWLSRGDDGALRWRPT